MCLKLSLEWGKTCTVQSGVSQGRTRCRYFVIPNGGSTYPTLLSLPLNNFKIINKNNDMLIR